MSPKMSPILISGWASDLDLWAQGRILSYGDLLPDPNGIWERYPELQEAAEIVAWSMGTLALLRNSARKPLGQVWHLVCPIADYCHPSTGWSTQAVELTKQGILADSRGTLLQFAALMGACEPELQDRWLARALRYSPQDLAVGLDYLKDKTATEFPEDLESVHLYFGEQDQVVPLAQEKLFPQAMPSTVVKGAGHWLGEFGHPQGVPLQWIFRDCGTRFPR
jgi:pimeloyl-ACP methyl ester carboxylesterase